MRGRTMDNSYCEWIRGRLPLYAGAGDGPADDGVDLVAADRRAIERHLAGCPACRGRRSELVGALGALAVTAGEPPIAPDAPSLWPALERRIAGHRACGASGTPGRRDPGAIWEALDDDRPLRSAWVQDTLREVVESAGLGPRPGRSAGPWRVVGASLAASVLVLLVVVPVAFRLRAGAEARMLAYSLPVAPLVGPPAPPPGSEATARDPLALEDERDPAAGQLAQAEPIKPPPPADPPARAATEGRPSASRFGYDLEIGNPMPPDGRDAKPVY